MKRSALGYLAILAGASLLGGCLGSPTTPGQQTMNCVNTVLNTDAPLPTIVQMKQSDFAAKFGGEHNGYFAGNTQLAARDGAKTVYTADNTTGTIYLSSRRDATILPHELAHHARVYAGGGIDEAEAERAGRLCSAKTRVAPKYSVY